MVPGVNTRSAGGASASAQNPHAVLAILALVSAIAYLHRTLWSVLAISVKSDLALSDTQVGMLGGFAFAMCYALMGVPLARLSDRGNRVAILTGCAAVWAVATVGCGMAQSFATLFAARVALGLGEAGCLPASHSILADCYAPERRAFAFGMLEAGAAVGSMAGIMLAGVMADSLGWRFTFLALGLPGLLVAALLFLTVRDPPRGRFDRVPAAAESTESAVPRGGSRLRDLLRSAGFLRVLVVVTLSVMGYYGILQWLPSFFSRTYGMSLSDIGVRLGFAFGFGSIAGSTLGGLIAPRFIARDRRNELRMPALAYVSCAPVFILAFNVGSPWLALGLVTIASLVMSVGFAPAMAAIQSVVGSKERATAVAIAMFVSALLGQGLGPIVVGVLSDVLAPSLHGNSLRTALSLYSTVLVLSGAYAWWASAHQARLLR